MPTQHTALGNAFIMCPGGDGLVVSVSDSHAVGRVPAGS